MTLGIPTDANYLTRGATLYKLIQHLSLDERERIIRHMLRLWDMEATAEAKRLAEESKLLAAFNLKGRVLSGRANGPELDAPGVMVP